MAKDMCELQGEEVDSSSTCEVSHETTKTKKTELGVIEPVPSGTDTTWCHKMVIVPKKDMTPRRTINFQPLNAVAARQTHHTPPPFEQVSRQAPSSQFLTHGTDTIR